MDATPPFAFVARPTRDQLVAAVRLVSRRTIRTFQVVGLVLLVLAVVTALTGGGVATTSGLAGGGLVALVLVSWRVPRVAARTNARLLDGPIRYRIDAEGVSTATDLSEGLVRWPLIEAVDEVPGALVLRLARNRFIPVPVSGLPPEAASGLAAFVRAHTARAGSGPGSEPAVRPPAP